MNMLRRKFKVLLVPLALIVLVVGTALPASAATTSQTQNGQGSTLVSKIHPNSLNW